MTTALTLPSAISNERVSALITKKGSTVGTRVIFGSAERASDVRARLRKADPTLRGDKLTVKVNEVLSGKASLAKAEFAALTSAMWDAGYQPDSTDVRKNSAVIRLVKPIEPKSAVATVKEKLAAMDKTERDEILALLMAD